ncbi:MAG: hypothetical protein CMJ76_02440 [Planctomycetaceae bacterium]|nr:hypothetical protein [Planctomycetaceae bacterium]
MTTQDSANQTTQDIRVKSWVQHLGKVAGPVVFLSIGFAAIAIGLTIDWYSSALSNEIDPVYVGKNKCIECHQQEAEKWTGSHHDLAMQVPTEKSVLGDFNNASLEHHGVTSTMFRRGDKFMINTEGEDGEMHDFAIKFVFGVDPLQQYLVEFDRPPDQAENEIGRLQVLRISWDSKNNKWFHLDPPDVHEKLAPEDDLHWTGIAQRWNNMCADCHSTNLKKNFDPQTNTYHTTFSEINVSCETCHGPGSVHVELAEAKSLFWDRQHGYGLPKLKGDDALTIERQIQSCAPCHSRRRIVHPDFSGGKNFHDHFAGEPMRPETYHKDGQIMDEVYVLGSFIQSKMYHKGIKCTDCHDPHSVKVKFEDNRLCTSCHQHPTKKYDTPAHHHHKPGSKGASCVECHMPETTYMAVDPRRDHSLRVPRPDLSLKIGTPNACVKCHLEDSITPSAHLADGRKEKLHIKQYIDWIRLAYEGEEDVKQQLETVNQWANDAVLKWYPESKHRSIHFGETLHSAWALNENANDDIIDLFDDPDAPAIAKASAMIWLDPTRSADALEVILASLQNPNEPQLRVAAILALQNYRDAGTNKNPFTTVRNHVIPLLDDPIRSVRTAAAQVSSEVPSNFWPTDSIRKFQRALEELEEGLMVNNDRAATHLTLGSIYENLRQHNKAEQAYRLAIQVEPNATGPRSNLAELYTRLAENITRQYQQNPQQAPPNTQQTLQNYLMEAEKLRNDEFVNFQRDASYAPENAAVQYRYGLALYRKGQLEDAVEVLRTVHELEPRTPIYMIALSRLLQTTQQYEEALKIAKKLIEIEPQHQGLVEELLQQIKDQAPDNNSSKG